TYNPLERSGLTPDLFIKHIPEDMTFNMVIYLYYVSDCLLNQIKYIRSMMNIIYLLRTLIT
ncbi:hypothetical protein FRA45_28115, partial [Escherichia coli]